MKSAVRLSFVVVAIASLAACDDTPYGGGEANNGANDKPASDRPQDELFKFDRAMITGARGLKCGESDSSLSVGFVLLDQNEESLWPGDTVGVDDDSVDGVEVTVGSGAVGSARGPELLRCPTQCVDGADCEREGGRFCSDGFCSTDPETTAAEAHAVCSIAGLDRCGPLRDGDPESLLQTEPFSVCRQACAEDAECGAGRGCIEGADGGYCAVAAVGASCVDDSDCAAGSCVETRDGPGIAQVCQESTTVSLEGELRFDVVPETVNLAIVMDDSGSLFGRGVVEGDRTVRLDRATDPDLYRIAAMKALLLNLRGGPYGDRVQVAVWSFRTQGPGGNGPDGVRLRTGVTDDPTEDGFASLEDSAPTARVMDQLSQTSDYGRSNVFDGVEVAARNLVATGRTGATLLVFTDGPDDSFTVNPGEAPDAQLAARAQALDRAIEAVQESEARIVIVHLDSGIGADGLAASAPDALNVRPHLLDAGAPDPSTTTPESPVKPAATICTRRTRGRSRPCSPGSNTRWREVGGLSSRLRTQTRSHPARIGSAPSSSSRSASEPRPSPSTHWGIVRRTGYSRPTTTDSSSGPADYLPGQGEPGRHSNPSTGKHYTRADARRTEVGQGTYPVPWPVFAANL
jgi:hypothetical protein